MFKNNIRIAFAAAAMSVTASAATVTFNLAGTSCPAGLCSPVTGVTQIDFNDASGVNQHVSGAATFSFSSGMLTPFVTGSVVNEYAAPPSDATQYLTLGSPNRAGSVTIDLNLAVDYYGLYLGSADSYNLFQFFETGNNINPIATFTGTQLTTGTAGDQSVGQYVNFYVTGGTVSRIVMSSSQAALETDNHAYRTVDPGTDPGAVPEPATMGLMGTALVGLGFFVRRRKS